MKKYPTLCVDVLNISFPFLSDEFFIGFTNLYWLNYFASGRNLYYESNIFDTSLGVGSHFENFPAENMPSFPGLFCIPLFCSFFSNGFKNEIVFFSFCFHILGYGSITIACKNHAFRIKNAEVICINCVSPRHTA